MKYGWHIEPMFYSNIKFPFKIKCRVYFKRNIKQITGQPIYQCGRKLWRQCVPLPGNRLQAVLEMCLAPASAVEANKPVTCFLWPLEVTVWALNPSSAINMLLPRTLNLELPTQRHGRGGGRDTLIELFPGWDVRCNCGYLLSLDSSPFSKSNFLFLLYQVSSWILFW